MPDKDSTAVIWLGNLGLFGACVLFASPIPTMLRIVRSKSTLSFSPDPYFFSVVNCMFWCLYALPSITADRTSPLITNFIGTTINFIYICVFAYYNSKTEFWRKLVFFVALFAAVFCVVWFVAPSNPRWFGLSEDDEEHEIKSKMLGVLADV